MDKYIFVSEKSWNIDGLKILIDHKLGEWILINNKDVFNKGFIDKIKPKKIFIPHWSYIIPEEIFLSYECIVFHMTDLPFGQGGSPLQNLIERKIYQTKVSALKVLSELDSGPIYLKEELSLWGNAEEIYLRSNAVIISMIVNIIENNLKPIPQVGTILKFKRRKPEQSNISDLKELEVIFDYIRMLDAEGYPKAFMEIGDFRYEFSRASIKSDKSIIADVRIFKK